MEHYRRYLEAELGKLRTGDDARTFLEQGACSWRTLRLPTEVHRLIEAFATQDTVDAYVRSLRPEQLIELTACCDRWRRNGMAARLRPDQVTANVTAPIEDVLLSQAEPHLGAIFRRHGWWLVAIANDPELLVSSVSSSLTGSAMMATCSHHLSPSATRIE